MKLILIILLFISSLANATVYYVSNSGSDLANGTSTGTAWATISKVNSSSFNPGDQILFNRGDSWNERLQLPSSGTIGNVITIGAYGSGVKPLITGFQSLSGFTNVGNIYSITATNAVKKLNTVLVSGILKAKARTPNTGWSTFSSYSGNTQITTALSGTPNYTGSEIVVRTAHWIIDVVKISSQSGGVLNFSQSLTYTPSLGGNGYFIQNTASDLDLTGEWTFDSTTKVLKVYSPTSPFVQISSVDTLVWLRSKNYITFDGLSFTGSNKAAFQLDTSSNITIQNCSINNSGALGISALKSVKCTILNDSIQNSLSGAVYLRQVDPYTPTINTCDSATIDGNYIKNTGHIAGMGMSDNGRYYGIYLVGVATRITNNWVDSTGYVALSCVGKNSLIKNNYITNFCFVKDDGAGIYFGIGAYYPLDYNNGTIVRGNIVINGIGALAGTTAAAVVAGIYLDDLSKNITCDSNTTSNLTYSGIFLHDADSNIIRYNTVINNIGNGFVDNGVNANVSANGNQIKQNIFYSASSIYPNFYKLSGTNLGNIDSNYYSRPLNETTNLRLSNTYYSLPAWKTATGKDTYSQGTPAAATSATALFFYNPTTSDSTIALSGPYIDPRGTSFNNSITLRGFSSALLYAIAAIINYNYSMLPTGFSGGKFNYRLN